MARDHEEHGVGLLELPVAEEVDAGDVAHFQVGDDEVDSFIQIAHGLVAGVGGGDLEAGVGEEFLHRLPFGGVVFDNEDFVDSES